MSVYTNTHTNHYDESSKKWPITIPWNTTIWETNQTLKSPIIDNEIIRQLRQHAKALENNFNFVAVDPPYTNVIDSLIEDGDLVTNENLNQEQTSLYSEGAGLLDGLVKIGIPVSFANHGASDGTLIIKSKIEDVAAKIQASASYANYSNYNNSGYGRYSAYSELYDIRYSQAGAYGNTLTDNTYNDKATNDGYSESYAVYSDYGRYNEYNRIVHFDGDADSSRYSRNNYSQYVRYANYGRQQTAPGYINGTDDNNEVAYSNAVYSNVFVNPAIYNNAL